MKPLLAGMTLFFLLLPGMPVHATQEAIIPAYAYVSAFKSSMAEYKDLIDSQNRAAARKLLSSKKVFIAPKDVKVEVVSSTGKIAKVRLNQLNGKAEPVTLYFWTLADQLKFLPKN